MERSKSVLDFSMNTNVFIPRGTLDELLKGGTEHLFNYPDNTNHQLKSSLASYFDVDRHHIGFGVGSTQIHMSLPKLLGYARAVILGPTFWEYAYFNDAFDVPVKKVLLREEDQFMFEPGILRREIGEGDCVFICNTNSPTSTLIDKDVLLTIIDENPQVHFVIDETYLLFHEQYTLQTLAQSSRERANLHVVTSASKFFGVPGLRLGVLISNQEVIRNYENTYYIPYSINPLCFPVMHVLLSDTDFAQNSRMNYKTGRTEFCRSLRQRFASRLKCFDPSANFVLCKILTQQSSKEVCSALRHRGVIVRGGHELDDLGDTWLRFSIRDHSDNQILLDALDQVLER